VALVALLSTIVFGESLTGLQIGGPVLVMLGVVALEVGAAVTGPRGHTRLLPELRC
jgi:multidrug transporter EmrE-like cation transporter